MDYPIDGLNVEDYKEIRFSPKELKKELRVGEKGRQTVFFGRQAIRNIFDRRDKRLLVITGPCSIHDESAAYDYARRLAGLQEKVSETMLLVMRVYFEKPRTAMGWEGLVNDPFLNDTYDLNAGISLCRRIALGIVSMGVPIGGEFIDPMFPPFYSELFSWGAIGARNVESGTQRRIASGLSAVVGFKNGLDGSLAGALNAMKKASQPCRYPSISQDGKASSIKTRGNQYLHLVLRGGQRPNYDSVSVREALERLCLMDLSPVVLIDCSHGNSRKLSARQSEAWQDGLRQIANGNKGIMGMMLESNIRSGWQKRNGGNREYGVSITDDCIGWEETEELVLSAHDRLSRLADAA